MTSDEVKVLPEPTLEFRYGQAVTDPHDGLAIFGPFDTDLPGHPSNVSYAVIGTHHGIQTFLPFFTALRGPIVPDTPEPSRLWPTYPGFDAAFACALPERPTRRYEIRVKDLQNAAHLADQSRRVARVVELYLTGIERFAKSDDKIDVVVCVVPDYVYKNCRAKSTVRDGLGYRPSPLARRQLEAGQLDMWDDVDPVIYSYAPDFRRQLKARAMEHNLPLQIVRESTLRLTPPERFGERGLTPLSDRAWNLGTTLFYKASGKPWRLNAAREGVCYIGLAYRKKDSAPGSRTACCAAQMFLDTGDGIVFLGEFGPWYSPERRQCHLTPDGARTLLSGVLQTYEKLEGRPLQEIFLHCRSGIDDAEFEGFRDACPGNVKLVGVRVAQERGGMRLFREGEYPVLRGTQWTLDERKALLWTSGYRPSLQTYVGWETPNPLRIETQHGDGDIDQVASDILALTKLNYNTCKPGDAEPVTVGFSSAVGDILVTNPRVEHRRPQFKFYI